MKRSNPLDANYLIQVKLDETIMDKSFFSQKKEVFSLKDLLSLLPRNLTRDELIDLNKRFSNEISERTSIICEMIPDDIWKTVFQLLAHKNDISKVFRLKQVSKRWESCFLSAIDDVIINKSESLKQICKFKSIRSLTIKTDVEITNEIFTNVFLNLNKLTLSYYKIRSTVSPHLIGQMTKLITLDLTDCDLSSVRNFINSRNLSSFVNLEYLKLNDTTCDSYEGLRKLVNLKEIDIGFIRYSRERLELKFGPNLNIIDHLPNLKTFTIYRPDNDFININQLQNRYPHVRFRWLIMNDVGYYEGPFSEDNKMSGKGKISYLVGDSYEGEFKNDAKEGKGVYYHGSSSRCEGEFKNDKRDGKCIITHYSGFHFEGEFKNDQINGYGVSIWPDGQRYEGQFKDDRFEGKGVIYWPDGNRFEGEFRNDGCYNGILYYSDGRRYEGEVDDIERDGKGVMFYSNGNRYEGIFEGDKRSGEGKFYYSNGKKVKGDESKFILNEVEGTIELLT